MLNSMFNFLVQMKHQITAIIITNGDKTFKLGQMASNCHIKRDT